MNLRDGDIRWLFLLPQVNEILLIFNSLKLNTGFLAGSLNQRKQGEWSPVDDVIRPVSQNSRTALGFS